MSKVKQVLLYLVKASFLGLVLAAIILLFTPKLRSVAEYWLFNNEPELAPKISFAQAANRASPAVVNIYTRTLLEASETNKAQLVPQGLGSGVIMSDEGHILTNLHVVANSDQIIIALQDGRIFNATLIGGDPLTDLVVLKIPAKGLPQIPQSPQVIPEVGDVVLAIGHPYNVGQTITQGIISATGRNGMSASHRQDFLQTDAAINKGNSGGALVNTRGELVGINTAAFEFQPGQETFGISFAIPYPLALQVMHSLIKEGHIIRGYLGIDGVDMTPAISQSWGLKSSKGFIVKGRDPLGPAAKAGIQVNDIIIKVANLEISGVKQAMDIVAVTKPGEQLMLTLLRDGKTLDFPITIEELKM